MTQIDIAKTFLFGTAPGFILFSVIGITAWGWIKGILFGGIIWGILFLACWWV